MPTKVGFKSAPQQLVLDERGRVESISNHDGSEKVLLGAVANGVTGFTTDPNSLASHSAEHRDMATAGTLITDAELSAQLAGLGSLRPNATDVAVLWTGDSITANSVRTCQADMAACAGRWVTANNAGIGGQRSDQILARLAADMAACGAKSVVLQSCTWNDIGQGISVAQSVANIDAMNMIVKAAGGVLFVGSPTPDGTTSITTPRVQAADARWWAFQQYCLANGAVFVDLQTPLVNPATGAFQSIYNVDGSVHPTDAAYAIMQQRLAEALNAQYPGRPVRIARSAIDPYDLLGGKGLFNTSSGGVGTGWSYTGISGATASVTNGVQSIAASATAGSAYMDCPVTATWSVGDIIEIRGNLTYDGGSALPRIRTVLSGSPNPSTYAYLEPGSAYGTRTGQFALRQTIATGLTGMSLRFQLQAGTGTSSISGVVVRNLTANGLV